MENLYPKHGLCEIDHAAVGKLRNKNADESWEIIENLALYDHEGPSPQPQALETTFEARVLDYMAAHTERMERFKNAIFKQREEINGRMTKMFRLLKELTTNRTPKKVLIREEAKFPVTKNVNSISLTKGEEERSKDITNNTRKRSKPDKHGHENGKECTRAGDLIAEVSSKWSTQSQTWSTGQPQEDKTPKINKTIP
ncbi:hypothetical protein Tco_1190939 [Tanacetum coccineum]